MFYVISACGGANGTDATTMAQQAGPSTSSETGVRIAERMKNAPDARACDQPPRLASWQTPGSVDELVALADVVFVGRAVAQSSISGRVVISAPEELVRPTTTPAPRQEGPNQIVPPETHEIPGAEPYDGTVTQYVTDTQFEVVDVLKGEVREGRLAVRNAGDGSRTHCQVEDLVPLPDRTYLVFARATEPMVWERAEASAVRYWSVGAAAVGRFVVDDDTLRADIGGAPATRIIDATAEVERLGLSGLRARLR